MEASATGPLLMEIKNMSAPYTPVSAIQGQLYRNTELSGLCNLCALREDSSALSASSFTRSGRARMVDDRKERTSQWFLLR